MHIYPVTVVDNFFTEPDAIRKYALSLPYSNEYYNYPGVRTETLSELNPKLFHTLGNSILSLFTSNCPSSFNMDCFFQKITPTFDKDKWEVTNRGWIHRDSKHLFGGVIYLNPNPDPDAGTSIYKSTTGLNRMTDEETNVKMNWFNGTLKDKAYYSKVYSQFHKQFTETVTVKNVYNRLILFDCTTFHGVPTHGIKERLTLPFFFADVGLCFSGNELVHNYPLLRMR